MKVDRDDKEQGPLHRTTDKEQGDLQKIVKQMEKPAKYCIEKLKCNLSETPRCKQKSPPSEDSVIAGLAELRQAIVAEIHRSHDGTARYDSGASRGLLEADVPSLWPTSNPTTQGAATSQGRPPARLGTTRGLLEADVACLPPAPRPPTAISASGPHRPSEPTPRLTDGRVDIRSTQAPAEAATAASLQSPAEVYEEGGKRESEAYKMLIEVERLESMMRDVLVQQVLATTFKLRKNGIVSIPAIAWDGSLGPEEQRIINRVGFLVNAYSVQTWYWEVSLSSCSLPSRFPPHSLPSCPPSSVRITFYVEILYIVSSSLQLFKALLQTLGRHRCSCVCIFPRLHGCANLPFSLSLPPTLPPPPSSECHCVKKTVRGNGAQAHP